MRIMTFNIQHALDYKNQVIDIDLFAEKIRKYGADICGLNEVRGEGPVEEYTDQTNAIADRIGFNRYFGEAIRVEETSPYGNALLSSYPLISCETVCIPDPEVFVYEYDEDGDLIHYESRCIIKAVVDVDGKELCILVTHMGLYNSEQKNAVSTLCRIIDETDIPLVLMGDFNTTADDEVLLPLYERLSDTDLKAKITAVNTYPSDSPIKKIDYIFYRGLNCVHAETVEEIISDHFPIIADFEF